MKRLLTAVSLLAVSVALLSAGCYTVIKHPTGGDIVQEGSYYRSCADCHADAPFYHPYGRPYYRYGRSAYGWGDYYGYPWWYDDYWWWDPYDHDGNDDGGPDVEKGTRHLWSPGGWASGGWGFLKPPSPDVKAPGSGGEQKDGDKNGKKDEDKEKKKEEEKPHLWKPRKKGF